MLSAVDGGAAEHAEAKQRDGGADAERPDEAQQRPDGAGRAQQHLQQRRAHDRALDLKHKPTLPPATGHSLRRHSTQAHTATRHWSLTQTAFNTSPHCDPPLVTHSDGIQHNPTLRPATGHSLRRHSTKVHTVTRHWSFTQTALNTIPHCDPLLVTHSDGIQHNSTKVHTATPPPTTPTGR